MLYGLLEKCSDTIGTTTNGEGAASPVLLSLWHEREGRGWESHCIFWVPFQQACGVVREVWAVTRTRSGTEDNFLTVDHQVGNRLGHPGGCTSCILYSRRHWSRECKQTLLVKQSLLTKYSLLGKALDFPPTLNLLGYIKINSPPSDSFLRICVCYFLGQTSAHLRAALHSTPGLIDPGAILWLPACVLSFPAEHAALGIRDLGILPPRVTTTFGELGARLKQNMYGGTHPSVSKHGGVSSISLNHGTEVLSGEKPQVWERSEVDKRVGSGVSGCPGGVEYLQRAGLGISSSCWNCTKAKISGGFLFHCYLLETCSLCN